MQIDRENVIQQLTDGGVLEHDGCGVFIASGDTSELITAVMQITQRAAEHALKDLEIMVTDQGVNIIKDGVLVAFQAHGEPRAQDVAAQLLITGKHEWVSPACHCEACDMAGNGGLRSRMSVCPTCGDKRCPHAQYHGQPCKEARDGNGTQR